MDVGGGNSSADSAALLEGWVVILTPVLALTSEQATMDHINRDMRDDRRKYRHSSASKCTRRSESARGVEADYAKTTHALSIARCSNVG